MGMFEGLFMALPLKRKGELPQLLAKELNLVMNRPLRPQ
jgi:hypothetical protein